MDIKKMAKEAGDIFLQRARDVVSQHESEACDEAWEAGVAYQKNIDVHAAVRSFLDLKIKDSEIFRLLSEYFQIDSIYEATKYLNDEKKSRQIIALRVYCENMGMSNMEFCEYAKSHRLEELLSTNIKLLELPPEKLKAIIDKTN